MRPQLRFRPTMIVVLLVLVGLGTAVAQDKQQGVKRPPLPPGMDSRLLEAYSSAESEKLQKSLAQALESIPTPSFLNPDLRPKVPETAANAPSPAIKSYVQGRSAYRKGNHYQAIRLLEQARRLDRHSADVLRLLGLIYTESGNSPKGAMYLREAVKLFPDDQQSLLFIGRFSYEQELWDEAISILGRALDLEDPTTDESAIALLRYYLGQSLLKEGYVQAGLEQVESYLQIPIQPRTTRLLRELAFLRRRKPEVAQQVGDTYLRLGDFEKANSAYELAAQLGVLDGEPLALRRIYCLIALKRDEAAQDLLINTLQADLRHPELIELVSFVSAQTGNSDALRTQLEQAYKANDRPSNLAMAIAEMLPDAEAFEFLNRHLAAKQSDFAVYARLVDEKINTEPVTVLRLTVSMIEAKPLAAQRFVDELLAQDVDLDVLSAAIGELDDKEAASVQFLKGVVNRAADDPDAALAAFQAAVKADPTFLPARLATVELHLDQADFDVALELLRDVDAADDHRIVVFKVRALQGLDQGDEALALLKTLITERPRNAEYRLIQADILRAKRRFREAEQALLSILEIDNAHEAAYTKLFDLYERDLPDTSAFIRLLRQVQRLIPASRIARLKMAEMYAARRENEQAETLLQALVREDPKDEDALRQLISLLGKSNKWEEAERVLRRVIAKNHDSLIPLLLYRQVARQLNQLAQFYELYEKFLKDRKPTPQNLMLLAALYVEWDRPDVALETLDAISAMDAKSLRDVRTDLARLLVQVKKIDRAMEQVDLAIKEQPDRAADLYYFKALLYHERKDVKGAEKALLAALEVDPKHAASNNDLGYTWADQGRNLEQAKEMIQHAVAAESENAAYLDSLGWVHYKLGEFQQAVRRLKEARSKPRGSDPVIMDHLGDSLWRLGEKAEAIRQWEAAVNQLNHSPDSSSMATSDDLLKTLQQKIEAGNADKEPNVAPVP